MSRFVNTPHGRADLDEPPFTVRTAGGTRPPREPATAATSAVRALDMSAADHTPGASGSVATAAEPYLKFRTWIYDYFRIILVPKLFFCSRSRFLL